MSGYIIVICIMLIMFAGLAIVIVQADADERRFRTEHEGDELLIPIDGIEERSADTNGSQVAHDTRTEPAIEGQRLLDSPDPDDQSPVEHTDTSLTVGAKADHVDTMSQPESNETKTVSDR